jgi:hypothetical protein
MTTTPLPTRERDWIGRMILTVVVACGALATTVYVAGALNASDHIVRVDNAVAELSHFIASGHTTIRERLTTPEPFEEAVTAFDAGVGRRLARIHAGLSHAAGPVSRTSQLRHDLDFRRIEDTRRAYVTAARTLATAVEDPALSLRRLEQYAQLMIVTIDTARDSAETSRSQALADANAMVMLALGIGGLVIAYLVWLPVFGRARPQSPGAPIATTWMRRVTTLF